MNPMVNFKTEIYMEELFMRKQGNHAILLVLSLIMFTIFIGCSSKQNSQNTFDVEQFANEMKAKNYSFELQDVKISTPGRLCENSNFVV